MDIPKTETRIEKSVLTEKEIQKWKDIFKESMERCYQIKNILGKLPHEIFKEWDKKKKQINKYELTSICGPLSRSFYKIKEILFDHQPTSNEWKRIGCLAEAPGGFIQGIVDTVKSENIELNAWSICEKNAPTWENFKYVWSDPQNKYIPAIPTQLKSNIHLFTSDITQQSVIKDLISQYSEYYELITADGGIVFDDKWLEQESEMLRLLCSEIYLTIRCLKWGGTAIIKIFDVSYEETQCLISILNRCFEEIFIYKGYTSRPGNSERYLICKNRHPFISKEIIEWFDQIVETEKITNLNIITESEKIQVQRACILHITNQSKFLEASIVQTIDSLSNDRSIYIDMLPRGIYGFYKKDQKQQSTMKKKQKKCSAELLRKLTQGRLCKEMS